MNKLLDMFLLESIDQMLAEFQKTNTMPSAQAKSSFAFLTDIAKGKVQTLSTIIRKWISDNPDYKHDSILSEVV